ncbi:MAG TPA: GMC family oxidoreductase [Candidatus Methylomirabilis sp.]|nr:GMC family oxidoreductase [Candidatus Methylomirabilis sp.]
MRTLPHADVVIVGGGWTGLLMAKELGSRTSLSIVVLERGAPHAAMEYANGMDELEHSIRLRLMQDASLETVTLRHDVNQRALPLRQHGSFFPGAGVGGAGEHWSAVFPRFLPDAFELYSRTVEKYGVARLPADHAIQDWGVTYELLEPYFTRVENLLGISGKAGNIRGQKIEGGNPFEGWRSAEYPTPPTKVPYFSELFRRGAESLGYHPYPVPAATLSKLFTNPDGVARAGCTYCGFCETFGCMIGAKAQPTNTLLPVIAKQKNVSIRPGANVRRIVREKSQKTGKVSGIRFIDASGQEFFQPADLVFLASWTLNNTRLLLLSEIGEPYDPASGRGTVGRNLTHQVSFSAATAFFDQPLNRFMGSGASGIIFNDFDGDLFDHTHLPFLRGGAILGRSARALPIGECDVLPASVKAKWGSEWKKALIYYYDRAGRISFIGDHFAYKGNYMDLDPTYKDHWGDPLLRLTLDWRDNERNMADFATQKAVEVAHAMGAKEVVAFPGLKHYDATRYQSTHIQGGAIMGTSPENSVVNSCLQHWQTPNLFILGASSFPQNAAANPTPTILAQTLRTADATIDRYLKKPGMLA